MDSDNEAERGGDAYYRDLLSRVDEAITDSSNRGQGSFSGFSGGGGSGGYGTSTDSYKEKAKRCMEVVLNALYKAILFIIAVLVEIASTIYEWIKSKLQRDNPPEPDAFHRV